MQKQAERRKKEAQARQRAESNDYRPVIGRPSPDAPLIPEMKTINDVISGAPIEKQLRRNMYGKAVKLRCQPVPNTHAFSKNDEEETPEQWTISAFHEYSLTEEIERFINYVNDEGDSVRPPMDLVKAYMVRDDMVLHTLSAIATMPIVLADGVVLGRENGFDPERGIHFVISEEIAAKIPRREDCTPEAVAEAMRFLTDEWLCDVVADYETKCTIIAAALTIIERSLLDQRPTFFVTAGRRGTGKTTLIIMLIKAITGTWPAASTWTDTEEERRKAIHSQFMLGVPYILWDNIPRGMLLRCPHIERSCTSAYYADRKLGVSEIVATAATSIHIFTGNNIGPRGDLSSRSLKIELKTDRSDPENREFKHPDPIGWTDVNRLAILRALYVVLLGNPSLDLPRNAPMRGRFKIWQRLIGTAVEHAAGLVMAAKLAEAAKVKDADPQRAAEAARRAVDFGKLFAERDADDEDDVSLGEVLDLVAIWAEERPRPTMRFKAADLCAEVLNSDNHDGHPLKEGLNELLFPARKGDAKVSAKSLGKKLQKFVDNPVRAMVPAEVPPAVPPAEVPLVSKTLVLRKMTDSRSAHASALFWVEEVALSPTASSVGTGNGI